VLGATPAGTASRGVATPRTAAQHLCRNPIHPHRSLLGTPSCVCTLLPPSSDVTRPVLAADVPAAAARSGQAAPLLLASPPASPLPSPPSGADRGSSSSPVDSPDGSGAGAGDGPGAGGDTVAGLLRGVVGFLVEYPLQFLGGEELAPTTFSVSGIAPDIFV
jgi:hypothetical protein